jgi:hypothetical protein
VLRAYIDDTGDWNDANCVAFGMSGLIGPVHEWHKLQAKWEDALDCCGSVRFHATDLQNLAQDYSGWTTFQRERLVGLLVRVVQESMVNLRLIGATVLMPDYKNLPEYRKNILGSPYHLCSLWAMLQATWKVQEDFCGEEVEFVFDQRQKQTHVLGDAYGAVLKTEYGSLCRGWTKADHRKVSLIQVADLTAYESKKYLDGRLSGKSRLEDVRWPVEQLENLFFHSKAALFNRHALWLASDIWNTYARARDLLGFTPMTP